VLHQVGVVFDLNIQLLHLVGFSLSIPCTRCTVTGT